MLQTNHFINMCSCSRRKPILKEANLKTAWLAHISLQNCQSKWTNVRGKISPIEKFPLIHWSTIQFSSAWTAACQASLSITNSWRLLKLMAIESVMLSNHLDLCHPLLLPPSIFPRIRVFSNESVIRIRWPKYWSFSFSISPSNEYSGLISFRMDWLDLLAVQGTLKSLLQHNSSKTSILPLSFLYSPTLTTIHDYWKNHSFD